MCDPMTIGSIVAQGAGVALQNRAANKANALQALRMQQTRERNRGLEDQQAAAIQNSTNAIASNVGKQGIEAAGNELSKILQAALSQRKSPVTASDRSAPKVFMDQSTAAQIATNMRAAQDAQNIAKLDAANRFLTQTIAPKIADSAATGQLTGNFMRGNTNVLDTGMRSAASMARSPMAQLLQGAGQVGLGYSLYDPDKED
tara:strand:- start:766 stop:1371 length:606 start_codon:yes stop_codon:yes gene_type:complete